MNLFVHYLRVPNKIVPKDREMIKVENQSYYKVTESDLGKLKFRRKKLSNPESGENICLLY